MKHLSFACAFLVLVTCMLPAQTNPVPFINQPLVPETVSPGSGGFTLTVHGAGFAPTAVLKWNGSVRPTSVLSATQLQATIGASDVHIAVTARVTVANLDAHNETSNVAYFTVRTPAPAVAMIPSSTLATGFSAVGDFNNDNKLDVFVLNQKGVGIVADVYLGEGKLKFQPPIETYFAAARQLIGPVVVGDFNGDHNLDVAFMFGHGAAWELAILFGDGKGKFTIGPNNEIVTRAHHDHPTMLFPAGDLNGDGILDLIVTLSLDSGEEGSAIALLGKGDGTFPSSVNIGQSQEYGTPETVVVGDFNEDGNLDVASLYFSSIFVGINQGNGQFGNFATYNITGANSIATADVNGDGHLDLITSNGEVLLGNGDGTFTKGEGAVFQGNNALITGDFNGDNKLDLLFPGSQMTLALGNGDGTFQSPMVIGYGFDDYQGMAVASFKPDGHLGLVGSGTVFWQVAAGFYPPLLDFGDQNVGTQSAPQTATLVNAGSTPLPVTQIGIGGTNATDFSQTNNCPASVPVGGSCQVQVVFAPQTAGNKSASLNVTYTGPGSPQSVLLGGTGVAVSTVSLTPSNLTFPLRIVDTTSPPQTATLANTGSLSVNISSITAQAPFSQTNNCPSVLPVGQSCQIQVTFRPTQNGAAMGTLSVTDDAMNSPQTVTLSGQGTTITYSPIGVNFGQQKVGTSSNPVPVTLSNKGTVTLNISKIVIGGTDPGDFSQTNNCGSSVPAGGQCTIQVTFTPTQKGSRSAKVQVYDNVEPNPQEVVLGGTGT